MFNITEGIFQQSHNIIKYFNAKKFRYDYYLAIFIFKLLSYVIMIDIRLSESGEIFGWRWVILDNLLPSS